MYNVCYLCTHLGTWVHTCHITVFSNTPTEATARPLFSPLSLYDCILYYAQAYTRLTTVPTPCRWEATWPPFQGRYSAPRSTWSIFRTTGRAFLGDGYYRRSRRKSPWSAPAHAPRRYLLRRSTRILTRFLSFSGAPPGNFWPRCTPRCRGAWRRPSRPM